MKREAAMTTNFRIDPTKTLFVIGAAFYLTLATLCTKDLFFVFQWGLSTKYIWLSLSYIAGLLTLLSLVWAHLKPVSVYFLAITLVMPVFKLCLVLYPNFAMQHVSTNALFLIVTFLGVGFSLILGTLVTNKAKAKAIVIRALLVVGLMLPIIVQYTRTAN